MSENRIIIDCHVHIFNEINGMCSAGHTHSIPYGKVKTEDGEIQIMPPYSKETSFTAENIVEMMNFAGVSKAILLQNPLMGDQNDIIEDAINQYPDRFIGTIQVDPTLGNAVDLIKKYSDNKKHNILKFEMSDGWGWNGVHKGLYLTDECFKPIWAIASERGLPVIIDPGRPNNAGYQVEAIDAITSAYPQITFILEHLGAMNRENLHLKDRWTQMVSMGKKKNVYLGIAAVASGLREDFPCKDALGLIKEGIELAGSDKLLWGSDIPGTFKQYTYQQMIDIIVKYADFLSEQEKDMIMRGTALKIFKAFN
jgi:predicted TIM-barrel fold metal-dependent hydrolase